MVANFQIFYRQNSTKLTHYHEIIKPAVAHNPEVGGSIPSSANRSGGCNGFQLHPPVFTVLFLDRQRAIMQLTKKWGGFVEQDKVQLIAQIQK